MAENDFCLRSPVDCKYPVDQKLRQKFLLSRSVSKINLFSCFTQKFKMATKSGGENDFCEKWPVDSGDIVRLKNFIEIALSHSISEISGFLHLMLKFKMATKSGGKNDFCEKWPVDSGDIVRLKNFIEIALSHSISEISGFLHLMLKFKMAAKSGGKTIFVKSYH